MRLVLHVSAYLLGLFLAIDAAAATEFSYDEEFDTGFCMQLLGESWVASDQTMAWPRQSFTVQMYIRPLVDGQDSHFFQVVNNPVEFQPPQGDLSVTPFGQLGAPEQETVFMAMYHYDTLYLEFDGIRMQFHNATLFERKEWHLLTLAWDQGNNLASVYLDDDRIDTQVHPRKTTAQLRNINRRAQSGHVFVGRQRWQQKSSIEIDDVRVFSTALSAQDVLDIYSQRNVPWRLADHLLLEWRFDEPLISNITDSSLNGRSGTVFRKDVTRDSMGSDFVQYRPVNNLRFDGKSTAKVPSRSGLQANARDGVGALSPAYTRLSTDALGNLVTANTSTSIAIVQGYSGGQTVFNIRLLPIRYRMMVSSLPSHGVVTQVSTAIQNGQGASFSGRAVQQGDVLESDDKGYIRMRYISGGSLATSAQRTDTMAFGTPVLVGASPSSAIGTRLAEVEVVRLLLLYNERPVASNLHVDVFEDSTTFIGLGEAGEIGAGGIMVQADTEGQKVTAIIIRVPNTGGLYQVLADGTRGVQIVADNLPLDVSALGSSVAYVPPADRSGENMDTISFRLRDELGMTSDPANVTFSVVAVHDQPTPGECPAMTQLIQNITGLSLQQQAAEDEWLARNCIGMCPADRIQVEEDGSIFFKLEQHSIEDSLVMLDIVSAPLFGRFEQVMTSSRNQNPLTAPTRVIDLAAAQGSILTMWATRVLYYSSSFGGQTGEWSPQQILGPANTYPSYGDSPKAWGPSGGSVTEYLELEFGERVYVTGIDVYETWFTGHITRVSFRHPDGTWIPAWSGEREVRDDGTARIFSPRMCSIPFPTSQVRLDLTLSSSQATLGNTFPQIDAVLLVGTRMPPPGRLLFTPGTRTGVTDVGSGADGSSDWGSSGGAGSGGSQGGQIATSGGGSLAGLVGTPPAVYWVKYLPDPDYSGVDRLVYATNDCKFDSEFRGTQRPCKEMQLNVQATNDPPVLLNPWTLPASAATGGLIGESVVNATIAVIENQEDGHDDLDDGELTEAWRLSARVEADECTALQAGTAQGIFTQGNIDTAVYDRAQIQSALDGCGASLMLRAKDPDVRQGDLRFDVVKEPAFGTLTMSKPMARNTTLNLKVDAASYAETLGLTGSHVNDFVTACSILDQNALAEAIGLAADGDLMSAGGSGSSPSDGMDDSLWASASDAVAAAVEARAVGRRQLQMDGQASLGPSQVILPRDSGWRGSFTGRGRGGGGGGRGGRAGLRRMQSVYTQTAEGRSFDEEALVVKEQSLTIGELNQTAIVLTYVPNGEQCGSGYDELWVRAADQGVGGDDGTGSDSGSGFGSNSSDSSRILRVRFDVKCTTGTRHLTEGQKYAVFTLVGLAGCIALLSTGAYIWAWSSKAVSRAQPRFTVTIGVGALGLLASAMLRFIPPTPVMCDVRRAAVTLSFLLMFGVCTAKTFRVFRLLIKIHINPSLRRVQFSEMGMLAVVGVLALIEALILGAWAIVSPSSLLEIKEQSDPMITHLVCDGPHHNVFNSIWLVFNAGIIGFTVYLAVVTRNVNSQQGESQWMSYALYMQTVCALLAGMTLFALDELPREQTLALTVIACVAAGATPALTLGRRALLGLDLARFTKSTGLGATRIGASSNSRSQSRTNSKSGSIVDLYNSKGKPRKPRKSGSRQQDTEEPHSQVVTAASTDGKSPRSAAPGPGRAASVVSNKSLKAIHTGSTASWMEIEKKMREGAARRQESSPSNTRTLPRRSSWSRKHRVHPVRESKSYAGDGADASIGSLAASASTGGSSGGSRRNQRQPRQRHGISSGSNQQQQQHRSYSVSVDHGSESVRQLLTPSPFGSIGMASDGFDGNGERGSGSRENKLEGPGQDGATEGYGSDAAASHGGRVERLSDGFLPSIQGTARASRASVDSAAPATIYEARQETEDKGVARAGVVTGTDDSDNVTGGVVEAWETDANGGEYSNAHASLPGSAF